MIKCYVGPMYSGKSDSLIKDYQSIWNKDLIIAFKPRKDVRDGPFIKSKNYEEKIPAIFIDDIREIINYVKDGNFRTVLIDEAELLTGDVTILADLSVLLDIDFKIAGLNMTSEQEPFGIMGDILAVSDEIEVIKGSCQDCGRDSVYSFYTSDDKEGQIKVGDTNYISLCPRCLRMRKKDSKILSLIKTKGEV